MGGYGSFKLGFTYPDRFAAIASFSGALDFNKVLEEWEIEDLEYIFGKESSVKGTNDDLFYLAEKLKDIVNRVIIRAGRLYIYYLYEKY